MLNDAVSGNNISLIALLITLMLVNWGIEARKWQVLVSRVERINLFTAFRAVLSGLSLSLFVPNGIGDYAGRIAFMHEGNRLRSLTLTLVGSMAQLIVTLTAGLFSLIYLKNYVWQNIEALQGLSAYWVGAIIFMIAMGAMLMLFIYF